MNEKIIDEVMGLVAKYGGAVESTVTGNPENHSLYSDEESAYQAIRAKLREVLERKPLTDEKILALQESYVGGICPQYPLDSSDWINFARAIEINHNIK